jgi:DNA-binding transcriptional MerR regulator
MTNHKHLTIGCVAKQLGICTETIRYYHRIGLPAVPDPLPGSSVRVYREEDVCLIKFIKQTQSLGFCLAEIRLLIALSTGCNCEEV